MDSAMTGSKIADVKSVTMRESVYSIVGRSEETLSAWGPGRFIFTATITSRPMGPSAVFEPSGSRKQHPRNLLVPFRGPTAGPARLGLFDTDRARIPLLPDSPSRSLACLHNQATAAHRLCPWRRIFSTTVPSGRFRASSDPSCDSPSSCRRSVIDPAKNVLLPFWFRSGW